MFSAGFEHGMETGQRVHPSFLKRAERYRFYSSPCKDFVCEFDSKHSPVSFQRSAEFGWQFCSCGGLEQQSCRFALSLWLWGLRQQVRYKQLMSQLGKIKHLQREAMSAGFCSKGTGLEYTLGSFPPTAGTLLTFSLQCHQHPICRRGAVMLLWPFWFSPWVL